MGIYIKDMDMPKSCIECLLHGESACKAFTPIEPWTFKDDERAAFCPLNEVPEPKWIPCSERLPKENEYVDNVCKYYLIQDEYGDMHVAHLSGRGWETIESIKALGCDVIAWMPLPKPYREESEVEE